MTRRNLKEYKRLFAIIFPNDRNTTALPKITEYRRWLIRQGRKAVGIMGVYTIRAYPDDRWMDWFGLVPETRGSGLGQKALSDLIVRMKKEGAVRLMAWSTTEELDGKPLGKFYARNKYRKRPTRQTYRGYKVFTFERLLGRKKPKVRVEDLDPGHWLH